MGIRHGVIAFVLAAGSIAGCASSSTPTDVPGELTPVADAGTDIGTPDAMVCDLGTPLANLPALTGEFLITGDGGVTTPQPSGGDPTGMWKITRITVYLPPATGSQLDTMASTISGTGWATFDGTNFRLSVDSLLTLETIQIGTVPRPVRLGAKGTYTVNGSMLSFAASCSTVPAMTTTNSMGFSRDAPTRARLFANISGMLGSLSMVFELTSQ